MSDRLLVLGVYTFIQSFADCLRKDHKKSKGVTYILYDEPMIKCAEQLKEFLEDTYNSGNCNFTTDCSKPRKLNKT